jgi:hypothetical protein
MHKFLKQNLVIVVKIVSDTYRQLMPGTSVCIHRLTMPPMYLPLNRGLV